MSREEFDNTVIFPVRASSWPFYEDPGPDSKGMRRDKLKRCPEPFKQLPMELDFGNRLRTSLEVNVLPSGIPCARSREPQGI